MSYQRILHKIGSFLKLYIIDRVLFFLILSPKSRNYFLHTLLSLPRYEVEYDEHRLSIAKDIGRRFLAIDVPIDVPIDNSSSRAITSTSAGDGATTNCDGVNNATTATTKSETEETEKTDSFNCNNSKNYRNIDSNDTRNHNGAKNDDSSSTEVHIDTVNNENGEINDSGGGGGGDDGGGGGAGSGHKKANNRRHNSSGSVMSNKKFFYGNDDLVLDVLNDDLIARVRDKITGK